MIDDLLHKEMTRRQFLQYAVGAVFMMAGLGNIISWLTKSHSVGFRSENRIAQRSASGFGTRKFGE